MKYIYFVTVCGSILASCAKSEPVQWCKISGGLVKFGSEEGMENEKPEVGKILSTFYLSSTEVSNTEFEEFVEACKYKTDAEKAGASMIYRNGNWNLVKGANWRHPNGPDSHIEGRMDFPVVHVSYNDAMAYCAWKGVRLPCELELEYALEKVEHPLSGMNITKLNKVGKLAAVRSAEPDRWGCYHLAGNVWEWCQDVYNYEAHEKLGLNTQRDPVYLGKSFDPLKQCTDTLRVIKGGSFLCQSGYCAGYLSYARQSCEQSASYFHIGFRVAKDR